MSQIALAKGVGALYKPAFGLGLFRKRWFPAGDQLTAEGYLNRPSFTDRRSDKGAPIRFNG
jgi:hypothetical protein